MKNKDLFGILENAENDSMDRLIEKCPEISDEQLDRILEMSERKYNMKSKGTGNTEKNIRITENNVVEGVERTRRPLWLAPLSMAASLILVAGIAIGSTAIIRKNSRKPDDDMMALVTTTSVTATTAEQPASENITDTARTAAATTEPVTTEPVTAETPDADPELSIYVGKWRYIVSDTNNVSADGKEIATVEIRENGTYSYTGSDGSFTKGTVKLNFEEIGGTKIARLDFTSGSPLETANYYDDGSHNELHLGNGDSARLVKILDDVDIDVKSFAGQWVHQVSDGNYTVDKGAKNIARLIINDDATYKYYDSDNNITTGEIKVRKEEFADGQYLIVLDFYDGTDVKFATYYEGNYNVLSIGNGGMARFIRGKWLKGVEFKEIAGKWSYLAMDDNYQLDEASKDNGTVEIREDGTYIYTRSDGSLETGIVNTGVEEIEDTLLYTVNFYSNQGISLDTLRFGGYYHSEGEPECISIGNGGIAVMYRIED